MTAARQLVQAGLSVVVVEARDRIGGRVLSVRDFCDGPVEAGVEFVHGDRAAILAELRSAGLTTRPCPVPTINSSVWELGAFSRRRGILRD